MVQSTGACPKCGGTGKIIHEPCPTCRGKGAIRRNKKITVNIPAGIDDGQTVSLKGQGSAGTNGGPAGDLLVTVAVRESDKFERDGTSVLSEATVSFAQAALGADLQGRHHRRAGQADHTRGGRSRVQFSVCAARAYHTCAARDAATSM